MSRFLASVCLIIMGAILLPTSFVSAQRTINDAAGFLGEAAEPTGVPTEDVNTRIGSIIKWALRLVGIIFLILMVYGGIRWMSARGNETEIEAAKETIIAAVIGLMVIVGAYALTNFITERLIERQAGAGDSFGEDLPPGEPNAPVGCCEFKFNEIPTWTAYPATTQRACQSNCDGALDRQCSSGTDFIWTQGLDNATCDARREDGLR